MTRFAYFEGAFVPIEQAKVSIMANVFNYGTGCFEGIRAYWNADEEQLFIFRPLEHYQRLLRSARVLFMELSLSAEDLTDLTIQLLHMENFRQDAYIRPLAYKATPGIGVRLHGLDDRLSIFSVPFGEYIQASDGAKAGVSSWRRLDDNAVPARAKIIGSYVNSAFAKTEALMHGYDEANVLTREDHVSEDSAENIVLVQNGRLVTPPTTDNILEGITRHTVMQIAAAELGIATDERPVDRSELYAADEIFFCGTGVQIVPVVEVDHRPVGAGVMGPVARRVRDLYFDVVRGKLPQYRDWCVPVYPR